MKYTEADKEAQYFTLYQKYRKMGLDFEAARLRASTESGTTPGMSSRKSLAEAKAQTRREMAERSPEPMRAEKPTREPKAARVSIRDEQDKMLRRNISEEAYRRLQGR